MRPAWILLISCLLSRGVRAESEAEKQFHEGKRLLKAGQLVEACAKLATSHELEPKPATLLNLADCLEQRGRTATARDMFVHAKALAVQLGDKRRELEAARRIAALDPRLSRLTVIVPSEIMALSPSILRGDVVVEPTTWNKPVITDPDVFTVRVRAPGYREWSTTYKLEPKQDGRVVVGPLQTASGQTSTTTTLPITPPEALSEAGRVAVGIVAGMNVQHESGLVGVRALATFDAPGGQLRAIASAAFSRYPDEPAQEDYRTTTISVGANAEYLWLPRRTFGLGGGLGIGLDYDAVTPKLTAMDVDGPRANDLGTFLTVRVTPVVLRLRKETVEAGVHVAALIAGDELTITAAIAVDWFIW